jgi:hypothetical protein
MNIYSRATLENKHLRTLFVLILHTDAVILWPSTIFFGLNHVLIRSYNLATEFENHDQISIARSLDRDHSINQPAYDVRTRNDIRHIVFSLDTSQQQTRFPHDMPYLARSDIFTLHQAECRTLIYVANSGTKNSRVYVQLGG